MTDAVGRLQRYVDMRKEKPLRGLTESIHGIHFGTEWEAEVRLADIREVLNRVKELEEALGWALEYIDAIPSDAAAKFPVMPGFDRDYVNTLINV